MAGIDLHSHTTYSDGTFAPAETVRLALERGLDVLAVSDHDTTEGLAEVADAANGTGLEIVPATEFSTVYEGGSVHVLAYWIDVANAEFQEELERLKDDREWRAREIVNKLNEMGHAIDYDQVRALASGNVVARPHIAQAMVEAGIVASIARMAEAGLDGIEADHPDHPPQARERYREMAARFGIPFTGSSDCHGTRYDPVRLGTVTTAPAEFARLKGRAGR
ncbi:MAG: PHP domain-containing protein [Actinobacteria bacterium]|nr:PHP domain-containing protein [Actinomycetota bacterium]